jgi:SAM-dependent methyltransferase
MGADRYREIFVGDHVRPKQGDRIIDLGCGPGQVTSALPGTDYVGIDWNARYIRYARRRYGAEGRFECEDLTLHGLDAYGPAQLVIAMGLLHHLSDRAADALIAGAARILGPAGRFVAIDSVVVGGATRASSWCRDWDRGDHIREPRGYGHLAERHFGSVTGTVRRDLLHVPVVRDAYPVAVLECTAAYPAAAA